MDAKRELEKVIYKNMHSKAFNGKSKLEIDLRKTEKFLSKHIARAILSKLPELVEIDKEKMMDEFCKRSCDCKSSECNYTKICSGIKSIKAIASAKPIRVKEGKK